ncbi:hypothetical protein Pfo_004875 [Paulownia fortunei]|nr:hypothetical protein Pfo_004875 [Paulownia fortunei]
MAATRVIASASNAIAGTLLPRGPLRGKPQSLSLCFRNSRFLTQRRRLFTCSAIYNPQVQTKEEGQPETLEYRVFFLDNSGKKISPWHDIPLHLGGGVFNFIVEIPKNQAPRWRLQPMSCLLPLNKIQRRENYDIIRTILIGTTGCFHKHGKTLHLLMLKWRGHLEIMIQGTLTAITNWFRDYKIPDGKLANKCGLGNKPADKDYALKVITETNESWAKLVKRSIPAGELSLL